MNKITKNGIFVDDGNEPVKSRSALMSILRDYVKMDGVITLRDLFSICEPIKEFISEYSQIDYDAYSRELIKPVDWAQKESCPIDHIEIRWTSSYFKEYNKFGISTDAHGVNSSISIEEHGVWNEEEQQAKSRFWAIDAQAVNNIADLPIRINSEVIIEELESGDIIHKWKKDFSLLDLIDAVFYEISFFGLPEDRDAFIHGLEESVEEIKRMSPEERDTRLTTFNLDEFKETLDDGDNPDGKI
jgi:hypothetical protein